MGIDDQASAKSSGVPVAQASGREIARYVTAVNQSKGSRGKALPNNAGAWTVGEFGRQHGFSTPGGSALRGPAGRPLRWIGLEVLTRGGGASSVMPWWGEIHNPQGVGGAMVAVSDTERLLILAVTNEHPRKLVVASAGTTIPAGTTVVLRSVACG